MLRESLAHSFFRDILAVGLFCLGILLYWSSLLQEQHLAALQAQMTEIQQEMASLQTTGPGGGSPTSQKQAERPHIDPSLPNLLTEDPFYAHTLATLLPPNFRPSGTRKMATVTKPDHLHPFSEWAEVVDWVAQCSVAVGNPHFGRFETLAPDMAIKMEERGAEFWVHLREGVYWAPLRQTMFSDRIRLASHFQHKHPVTAWDFKFYFDAVMNPWVQAPGAVAMRTFLQDIEEIRVIDPLTFAVRWKTAEVADSEGRKVQRVKYVAKWITGGLRPLASWVYQYFADGTKIVEDDSAEDAYRTNSAWAQNFNEHWAKNCIVSCGPWIFERMSDQQIVFRRNPDHYDLLAVLVEAMEVDFKESADGIWEDFKAGKLDSYELRPEQLAEWESFQKSKQYLQQRTEGNGINRLDYVSRRYSYIGWNAAKPLFANKQVRQALTMAIDRQRLIDRNLNGLGILINGPFFYTSKANDPTIAPWPFDPAAARARMESAGWVDARGTGTLEKTIDGVVTPFTFSLTYYVKNATAQAIGQSIALGLRDIGVKCRLNGVDIADLSAAFDDKSFDALYLAWIFGSPPEEPRQLWSSAGAKIKGSSNMVGFANAEADRIIDALDYTYDSDERIALYHRLDAIIRDEAPYTFLYTPKTVFLYRDYLQNVWIPSEHQDLVPDADMAEPQPNIFWLKR